MNPPAGGLTVSPEMPKRPSPRLPPAHGIGYAWHPNMKTNAPTKLDAGPVARPALKSQAATTATPAVRKKRGLSQAGIHFLVDVLLLAGFLTLVWLSAVLQFLFPPATKAGACTLWGLGYDDWSTIRFASLCVFCLMTLIHLILQWNWICHFIVSRVSRATDRKIVVAPAVRTLYGVGGLIVVLTLLGVLLAAAEFAIKRG